MEVDERYWRRGYGSLLVQELKRTCYEMGRIPAARCNVTNVASRATLQKAGFLPCGRILRGVIRGETAMPAAWRGERPERRWCEFAGGGEHLRLCRRLESEAGRRVQSRSSAGPCAASPRMRSSRLRPKPYGSSISWMTEHIMQRFLLIGGSGRQAGTRDSIWPMRRSSRPSQWKISMIPSRVAEHRACRSRTTDFPSSCSPAKAVSRLEASSAS